MEPAAVKEPTDVRIFLQVNTVAINGMPVQRVAAFTLSQADIAHLDEGKNPCGKVIVDRDHGLLYVLEPKLPLLQREGCSMLRGRLSPDLEAKQAEQYKLAATAFTL